MLGGQRRAAPSQRDSMSEWSSEERRLLGLPLASVNGGSAGERGRQWRYKYRESGTWRDSDRYRTYNPAIFGEHVERSVRAENDLLIVGYVPVECESPATRGCRVGSWAAAAAVQRL